SSTGRASETPAARRKMRRSSFMGEPFASVYLLGLEKLTLDNFVDQRPETVVLVSDLADNGFNLLLVGRFGRSAGGVDQQLLGQGAGELILVPQQQLLEFVDVLEALPVG